MAIRKRQYADGSFRYMIDFYDQSGIRRRETLPAGTTLKAAKELLRKYEDQAGKGVYVPDAEQRLFENVATEWLEYKKANLRSSTWSVVDGLVRNHLSFFFGIQINKISTSKIESWITDKRSSTHILTLRKILMNLGQIFRYAHRHKYIEVNPMLSLERLQSQGESDTEKEMNVLNIEQIRSFLDVVKDQKYHCLFALAIFSGAREGELLGLKWEDVLWETSQVQINRTFNNGKFFEPKTPTSKRKIDIGPEMMLELKKWKLACPPNELNLVFPNREGNPMSKKNMMNRHFKPAIKKAGISGIRFHDLRHSYCALKIHQGSNIKYIQQQMGHSKPTVTLNVYAHLFDKSNPESAKELESLIFNK